VATFIKRGEFQWQAKVRRRGHPIQSKTFTTKADAEVWARMIEREFDRDGLFQNRAEAERTTLNAALDRYATEVTPRKKGAAQEMVRIKFWQKHPLASRFLSTIRGADLAKYRDDRRLAGRAENTIRLDLALLSHVFETARKDWGMESLNNPARNVRLPSGSVPRDRRLQAEEYKYLSAALLASSQPIVKDIVDLALQTAMRQSEILHLSWERIDFDSRVIFLADTKNGESRNVPLSSAAIVTLRGIVRPVNGGRVFNLSQDRLIRVFQRGCEIGRAKYLSDSKAAGIPPAVGFLDNLRFHDLRHEATTRMFERGLDMIEVSSITGHKTLSMLKRYTHLRAEDLALKLG
jgi:integrase